MVYRRRRVLVAIAAFLAGTALLAGCVDDSTGPATSVPLQLTAVRPPLATPAPPVSPTPTVAPSPSPSPAAARTYTVREGDSLTSIATQLYGDADQWRIIFEANRDRLTSADQLQVRQELRIPPLPSR